MNWEDEAFYLTGAKNFEDFQKRVETYTRWQDPYIEEYKKEIERLNNIINNFNKLIDDLYEELNHRECGESYIYDFENYRVPMDVGYAFEGIDFFIRELKHKLKELKEE